MQQHKTESEDRRRQDEPAPVHDPVYETVIAAGRVRVGRRHHDALMIEGVMLRAGPARKYARVHGDREQQHEQTDHRAAPHTRRGNCCPTTPPA
ncbi:hypothetical protein ACQP2U_07585 [Nocardia sp. CA-084685]|uniref:hypothetical protein n=1 Tax=Nocardia sp. CA-084685 TaxID=3239970 RepID=UPI003D952335